MSVIHPHATNQGVTICFTDSLQRHEKTILSDNLSTYLKGVVTETPNLSVETDRRIRAGWMSLHAEAVRSPEGKPAAAEGSDGKIRTNKKLSYTDARHGPLLRATTTSSVLHITICCFESSPIKTPSSELDMKASKQPCARCGCCDRGRCFAWATTG